MVAMSVAAGLDLGARQGIVSDVEDVEVCES
jgi:hypothetical protein